MARPDAGNEMLVEEIRRKIVESPDRWLSFHDYMQECLYHPEYGYYPSDRVKIGKEGDFYTSSSIHPVFGEQVAVYALQTLPAAASGTVWRIEEWGAGTGRLALHVLDAVRATAPGAYDRLEYWVVEASPAHRELLRETLKSHGERVLVADRPGEGEPDLIFSNELLDAFPVHRVRFLNGDWQEIGVSWDDAAGFVERLRPGLTSGPAAYLEAKSYPFHDGQTIEINLDAPRWIERQAGRLADGGLLLTIDYGDEAAGLWSERRQLGTLMCYHRHQAHDNPYIRAGEQDMTAHVNFSDCIEAGLRAGCAEYELLNQRDFLLKAGILQALADDPSGDPFGPTARKNRAIRQLLLGDSMADVFKTLIQRKKGEQA